MTRSAISGFGHSTVAVTDTQEVCSPDDVTAVFAGAPARGVIARGRGRAYGDAAQNSGGVTAIVTTDHPGPVAVDEHGMVTAQAACTIQDILRVTIPRGWFVPVTPGTARATLGGCLAADVHGKNHHCDGTFGAHTTNIVLTTPGLGTITARQGDDEFDATIGGMGLTGVIDQASFQAIPISSSQMRVRRVRTRDLDHTMGELRDADARTRYSVAWLDLLARGGSLGRGVVIEGDHASSDDLPAQQQGTALQYQPAARVGVPARVPVNLLSRAGITLFNKAYYAANRAADEHLEGVAEFFHPLDAVRDWNRLYGRGGFVQYQFVVPDSDAGSHALVTAIRLINQSGYPGFLTVLKRFGAQGTGLLSFPAAGWTLTVDIPCGGSGLRELLQHLDAIVLRAGGRIYLAKDAVASPEAIAAMYPSLSQWRAVQKRLDPDGVLQSDMSRRLQLTASTRVRGDA